LKELIENIQATLSMSSTIHVAEIQALKGWLEESVSRLVKTKLVDTAIPPGRYICHEDEEHSFVVMLMSWEKGFASPIHTHACWGMESVIRGELTIQEYDDDPKSPKKTNTLIAKVGDLLYQMPPKKDVHSVENSFDGETLSLHVYGRNMCDNKIFKEDEGFVASTLETKNPDGIFDIWTLTSIK
jgi:predicted metal-dependent enzyme (double-stranded beta helix superfamily)